MSDREEERRVKARHDVTQFYQWRGVKRTTSQQDLPRGDKKITDDPNPSANSSSKDDDVKDDTYMASPRARPHRKGLTSASGSGAVKDGEEIEEEEDGGNGNNGAEGDDDEEDEEVLMLSRSTPLPTYTCELQFFSYPSTWIGGRKSATRARQIW
jgi:hypothetical protein